MSSSMHHPFDAAKHLTPWFATVVCGLLGCTRPIEDVPYCSAETLDVGPAEVSREVTWHQDIRPIIEGRCARCHVEDNIGPFPLTSYEETFAVRQAVQKSVVERTMPPWLPADCCNTFRDDFSLDDDQIALVNAWVDQGAPEGDPNTPGASLAPVGGLSRVDLEIEMREPYTPEPAPGRVDDFRCFLIDWPLEQRAFITGIDPLPGARAIVHHMIIMAVDEQQAERLEALDGADGRPGFDCDGGAGDLPTSAIVGGSLLGGDFPEGIGTEVEPGSRIVLNMHYSIADAAPEADLTKIRFKLDGDARSAKTFILVNPLWLVDDAMLIPAGEEDVVHSFQYDPRVFTGSRRVDLLGFTPHMHYLGKSIRVGVVRNGTWQCLAEIPEWDFGWEQPYWFEEPIRMNPGDELYIDCHFDNTKANQPIVDGKQAEPRDVAWGSDNQDMCSGFINFIEVE